MQKSKQKSVSIHIKNIEHLNEIAHTLQITSFSSAMNMAIKVGYETIMQKNTPQTHAYTVISKAYARQENPTQSTPQPTQNPTQPTTQKPAREMTYAERQEKKAQKSEDRKQYEYGVCTDLGGTPLQDGCKFDRYEVHAGKTLKWADQLQPYVEIVKPYFRNFALAGYPTKELAEDAHQKDARALARELAKQEESAAALYAKIERDRLSQVQNLDDQDTGQPTQEK